MKILPFVIFLAVAAAAKTVLTPGASAKQPASTKRPALSSARIQELENRLAPFLENRIRRPPVAAAAPAPFRDVDLFTVARSWSRLSPAFQALYKQAAQVPPGFSSYPTPGGRCAVLYSITSPVDGVSAVDTIGYGSGGNWRTRTHGPNGIPDYVDEVAWAVDSAWSMEIDRFSFVKPIPATDPDYPAGRYPVVIEHFSDQNLYGVTLPDGQQAGAQKGYASHIVMRNNWNGAVWSNLGYDTHPENAIRVTCVHELFHGVQFAMTWESPSADSLDDYPGGWLEGTAVLMEGLGFDTIKDYVQYAKAYFTRPTISFFVDPEFAYTNSLLTKFLYEKKPGGPGIDFIKRIFSNNYAKSTPFHQNLRRTSLSFGQQWVTTLNRFHTGTFFTGTRADTARFIADAALLPEWSMNFDSLPASFSVTKETQPYGVGIFAFPSLQSQSDTLALSLSCQMASPNPVDPPSWAASGIVTGGLQPDTVIPTAIDDAGRGWMLVNGWRSRRQIIITATNGNPYDQRNATVSLLACPVAYRTGEKADVRLSAPDGGSAATATLAARSDLRCSLTLDIAPSPVVALPSTLTPVSALFSLSFPLFWEDNASVSLSVDMPGRRIDSMKNNGDIKADSLALYHWNGVSAEWEKLPAAVARSASAVSLTHAPAATGIYCAAAPAFYPVDTSGQIVIFPNPAYLRRRTFMRFEGVDSTEIRIYSSSGGFVCSSGSGQSFQSYKGGRAWKLVNSRGNHVAPGSYLAVVSWQRSDEKKRTLHRVLVFP